MGGQDGTIRAQAKRPQKGQGNGGSNQPQDGRERMNKEVVKAVLASPLIIPWPNIPNHLQKAVQNALPRLAPPPIADYHLSRARCQIKDKKKRRKVNKADDKKDHMEMDTTQDASEVHFSENVLTQRPTPPSILKHLVLGINETIKTLERAIDDLNLRLMLIADSLNGTSLSSSKSTLLPTEPRSPSPTPSVDIPESAPLGWIIVALLSISPQSLVSPIPQYCASYNAKVYQWVQLSKVVKTRYKEKDWSILGEAREEVRVVPLGRVEQEMAEMVGLRRLACFGVRTSHPEIKILYDLLPKSVLHPPRYNITLPFPTSILKVHAGTDGEKNTTHANEAGHQPQPLPLPHVHYAPLSIKGINTTVPADGSARKQKRLEEVRRKRIEVKERKKNERRKEILKGFKGELGGGKGKKRGKESKELKGEGRRGRKGIGS